MRVSGIIGQPTGLQTTFGSSTFMVTADKDSNSSYLYRLQNGTSHQIKGMPRHFIQSKFYPTSRGLVLGVAASISPKQDFYLIDINDKATLVNSDLPQEIYVDQIFDQVVGYSQETKSAYLLMDGKIANRIDLASYSTGLNGQPAIPKIIVASQGIDHNSIWPNAYVIKQQKASVISDVSYLDFQNQILKNIYDQNGIAISNICSYATYDNAFWLVTCDGEKGIVWKTQGDSATQVTTFTRDSSGPTDLSNPKLNSFENILLLDNGRFLSLITNNGLQQIVTAKEWYANMCIAKLQNTLYCSCPDAAGLGISPNICSYQVDQTPIKSAAVGQIDGTDLRITKSVYDGNYYISTDFAEGPTYYYVLTKDGSLYKTDENANLVMSQTSPTTEYTNDFVNIVGPGEVKHYTIPGDIFSQSLCNFYACGSDDGGYYYLGIKTGTQILNTGYPANIEGVYYLRK